MKKLVSILILLMVCLTSNAVYAQGGNTIGVVGFVNRGNVTNLSGELVDTFRIADEYLIDGLIDGGKLDVIELSSEIQKYRLNEVALALDQGKQITEFGNVDVDYLVYGYVNDMSIRVSGGELYTDLAINAKKATVCVNMTANVVDAATGKTILSVSGKGESGISMIGVLHEDTMLRIGTNNVSEKCVHNALEKAVGEIAKKINDAA